MNLDSLTFSLSQINYLVANLNKKNFKQTNQELSQVSYYILHFVFVFNCRHIVDDLEPRAELVIRFVFYITVRFAYFCIIALCSIAKKYPVVSRKL